MHSVKMAFNLVRTGHLSKCEIKPSDDKKGFYNVQTVAPETAGNDRYTLTNASGEKVEVKNIDQAKDIAKTLGFKQNNVTVLNS